MNTNGVEEIGVASVSGEEAGEDRGAAGDERAAGKPNMEAVWSWERCHGRPLAETFDPQRGNWQPILNQAASGHWIGFGRSHFR